MVVVVEMVDASDVFVVEGFDEMLLRRLRGDVVVGIVEMWWLKGCWSKIAIAKEKRLPQRSQPCYTNNSLSTSVGKSI